MLVYGYVLHDSAWRHGILNVIIECVHGCQNRNTRKVIDPCDPMLKCCDMFMEDGMRMKKE